MRVLLRYCPELRNLEGDLLTEEQHGSFGGPSLSSDVYYGAGSDDFRGYVWKIPETQMLLEQRKEVEVDSWSLEEQETVGKIATVVS